MQTKLTLRLEDQLVRRAKGYARKSGQSVSQMVARFLALLEEPAGRQEAHLAPAVRSLLGALGNAPLDEADYYRHLEEKHR